MKTQTLLIWRVFPFLFAAVGFSWWILCWTEISSFQFKHCQAASTERWTHEAVLIHAGGGTRRALWGITSKAAAENKVWRGAWKRGCCVELIYLRGTPSHSPLPKQFTYVEAASLLPSGMGAGAADSRPPRIWRLKSPRVALHSFTVCVGADIPAWWKEPEKCWTRRMKCRASVAYICERHHAPLHAHTPDPGNKLAPITPPHSHYPIDISRIKLQIM